MALQVWMPFTDGTLKQQGLKNVSPTIGGTVDLTSAGKLGKCATIGTAAGGITLPASSMTSFTECSVAFWIKIISWNTSYATFFQAGLGSTPWNNYIFGILRNNANSNLCFTLTNSSGTSSSAAYTTSNLNTGQWYHLAFTYKAGTISIYIDGALDKTYSTTYVPNFAGITHISIGRSTNNSGYQTNCSLNDFRIYDHCLSPMEVKQLSQGLVLHYPLDRQGFGQENLLKNSHVAVNTSSYAMHDYYFVTGEEPIEGETYTIQIKGQLGQGKVYFGPYNSGGSVSQIALYASSQKNGIYTGTFNWRKGAAANTFLRIYHMNSSTVVASTIEWVKLEKGSIATPWSPNHTDEIYTTMGLNSTTEYDCSGFCNNGIRTGTFDWISDTPKYAVSQNCLGTNYIHLTPPSTEILTMAVWVNWKTIPSGQSVIFVDNGSGMGLGLMNTGILCSTSKAGSSYTFSKSSLVANTWYHFVVVKTGTTTRKLYINGVEQTATSNTSNWTFAVNELQLGKRSTTSDGFIGKLSDFRAYATALSAEDVKSLYQNCATIDPDGTIRGQIRS